MRRRKKVREHVTGKMNDYTPLPNVPVFYSEALGNKAHTNQAETE